jgi:Pyruvate/2-oxoacid:ferredoxin oxidoreductase delta subunit
MKFRTKYIRWGFLALAILLALPIPLKSLTGLLLWASPYMFLLSFLSQKSLVWLNALGMITLLIIFVRKRWVCRFICPAGALCDLASGLSRGRRKPWKIRLNRYLAIFSLALALFGIPVFFFTDPFNIIHMSLEVFRTGPGIHSLVKAAGILGIILLSILIPDSWCSNICPLGGLQFLIYDLRQSIQKFHPPIKIRPEGRRLFLTGLASMITGVLVPHRLFAGSRNIIRPPCALPDPDFNMVCARCGNCSAVCPTKIIRPSQDIMSMESFLAPVVDFSESYCLPECKLCGDVCPSGAIAKFSLDKKKNHIMARAVIHVDDCLLQQRKECDLCKYHCAYDAIDISRKGDSMLSLPHVMEDRCTGCAACKIICPVQVIEMTLS